MVKDIPRKGCLIVIGVAAAVIFLFQGAQAQTGSNPYRPVGGLQAGQGPGLIGEPWAKLPNGRGMGSPGGIEVDIDGEHLWAIVRCGDDGTPRGSQTYCDDSNLDPIIKFAPDGNVVTMFGSRMFSWPHGIHVDRNGNVWVTEAGESDGTAGGRVFGHQVFKFSPDGEVLMTLGEAGVAGSGPNHFNAPSDVITAPNGDIFVVDGHGTDGNNRIVKLSSDGSFIMDFGGTGYGPGELRGPHAIAMDADGRLFVADRQNQRIVIFDQEGNYINRWTQFGMPSDIAIANGRIYVADSESDLTQNPGWEKGIRVGDVATGWVEYFMLDTGDNPPITAGGSGAESLTVDAAGNIFAGEPRPQRLRKYIKVR